MKNKKIQLNYITGGDVYHLFLPMDIGELIPDDDSVRLLSEELERVDYSKMYAAYSRMGRAEISPKRHSKFLSMSHEQQLFQPKARTSLPARC